MCCTRPSSFGYTAGFGTAADACNQPVVGLHRTCSSAALDKVYKRLFGIFSEKYGTGSQENLSACRLSAVPLFLPYGSQNATISIIPEDSSRVKGKPQFSQRIPMEKSGEMAECKMWQAKHVEIQRISRKVKSFLHCAWKNAIIKVCFSEENREKERIYVIGYRNRTAD